MCVNTSMNSASKIVCTYKILLDKARQTNIKKQLIIDIDYNIYNNSKFCR